MGKHRDHDGCQRERRTDEACHRDRLGRDGADAAGVDHESADRLASNGGHREERDSEEADDEALRQHKESPGDTARGVPPRDFSPSDRTSDGGESAAPRSRRDQHDRDDDEAGAERNEGRNKSVVEVGPELPVDPRLERDSASAQCRECDAEGEFESGRRGWGRGLVGHGPRLKRYRLPFHARARARMLEG